MNLHTPNLIYKKTIYYSINTFLNIGLNEEDNMNDSYYLDIIQKKEWNKMSKQYICTFIKHESYNTFIEFLDQKDLRIDIKFIFITCCILKKWHYIDHIIESYDTNHLFFYDVLDIIIEIDNFDIFAYILNNYHKGHDIYNIFITSIVFDRLKFVEYFIQNRDIDVTQHDNKAIKAAATYCNDIRIIDLLINHGADIHADNDYALRMSFYNVNYHKSIIISDFEERYNIVEYFVKRGANVNTDNDYIIRYICYHAHNNVYNILNLLIKHGSNIHADDDFALRTLCHKHDNLESIGILLETGANPNAKSGEPIKSAILNKDSDVLKLLIKYGANLDFLKTMEIDSSINEIYQILLDHDIPAKIILNLFV